MKKHVIIDSDIGFDPDDFITLLLALNSEHLSIDLIVTNEEINGYRANLVEEILKLTNNEEINVVKGVDTSSVFFIMEEVNDENINSNYIEEISKVLNNNEKTYYLGIGSLRNLSNYIREKGVNSIFELVQMGGSALRREHNFNLDYNGAKYVFSQEIPITLITSEITNSTQIMIEENSLFHAKIRNSNMGIYELLLINMERFFESYGPFYLHDPLTFSYLINDQFFTFKPAEVKFLNSGKNMYKDDVNSNVKISTGANYDEFMNYVYQGLEI